MERNRKIMHDFMPRFHRIHPILHIPAKSCKALQDHVRSCGTFLLGRTTLELPPPPPPGVYPPSRYTAGACIANSKILIKALQHVNVTRSQLLGSLPALVTSLLATPLCRPFLDLHTLRVLHISASLVPSLVPSFVSLHPIPW